MHVISYVSTSLIPTRQLDSEISNVVKNAQIKNAEIDVTGVLFFEDKHFFQTIEGPEDRLRSLYDSIMQDRRHHQIVKIVDEPVEERSFSEWSMDGFRIDDPSLINPETILYLRKIYSHNYGMNAHGLIDFVKAMIDEMDTFRIKMNL